MRKPRSLRALGAAGVAVVVVLGWLSSPACAGQFAGATYYLSPNGADSPTGGSSDAPWRTLAYAEPRLQAGDTLYLYEGIYRPATATHIAVAGASWTPI